MSLDDLEGADAVVLGVLASEPPPYLGGSFTGYWEVTQLVARVPFEAGFVLSCLSHLGGRALTHEASDRYGSSIHLYQLTELGRAVFDLMNLSRTDPAANAAPSPEQDDPPI